MTNRIPTDAFQQYVELGDDRSYEKLASRLGVTKRSVSKRATKEGWQERLTTIERDARDHSEARLTESMGAMRDRHLKTMKAIQGKALEALKSYPLTSAMDAIRSLDLAVKQERLIRGEPTDRQAVSVEQIIRKEYDRWMVRSGNGSDD